MPIVSGARLYPQTSSDGVVTATVDTGTGSVLLRVTPASAGAYQTLPYTVEVLRTVAGKSSDDYTVVRGLAGLTSPGGAVVGIDHEAPLGVPVQYRASWIFGSSAGTSQIAQVTVPFPPGAAWLKCLSTPMLSQAVTVATYPNWTSSNSITSAHVLGARYPLVTTDVRGPGGATLTVLTADGASRDALDTLLQQPGPFLFQGSAAAGERDRYVMVGDVTCTRDNRLAADTWRTWTLALSEVGSPPPDGWQVSIPGRTYADIASRYTSYSTLPAVHYVDLS